MTLDIRGGRKNTAINHSYYVVLEEMLSNAIDSYLIRTKKAGTVPPFLLQIDIKVIDDLVGVPFDVEIDCADNGAGFGEDEVKAFVTKDSTYKDQLQIPGIGKCKGAGRIQFFHHFDLLSIDSVFQRGGETARGLLQVGESTREISEDSFFTSTADGSELKTIFMLKRLRQSTLTAEKKAEQGLVSDAFSAPAVRAHLYTTFLPRLIILKKLIGDFKIEVSSTQSGVSNIETIEGEDLPEPVGQVAEIAL